eukprot:TRINITY_DN671_c0_g3_i2.p1 TRINITY_DN671_c0_g3~~TRINITY_DN671_c0_g3_i2.p1  ORF type:complete len:456 (-),score=99.11 TRINITY_DN671_c0_g3_i2:287-1654(-)
MESIEDNLLALDCSICYGQLRDPRVVPCGHSFCRECLSGMKSEHLLCPLCRTPFASVDSLPQNWVVIQLMEQSSGISKQSNANKRVMCQLCEGDSTLPAVYWCEMCSLTRAPDNFCESCFAQEHSGKLTRHHVRVLLKDKPNKPSFEICKKHHKEKEFYCVEDKIFLCSVCVIDDHKPHTTISVFKHSDNIRERIKKMLDVLKTENFDIKVSAMKETLKKKEEEMIVLQEKVNTLKKEIEETNDSLSSVEAEKNQFVTTKLVLMKTIEEMSIEQLIKDDIELKFNERIQPFVKQYLPDKLNLNDNLVWEFSGNCDIISTKEARSNKGGAWAASNKFNSSSDGIIRVIVDTTNCNGWFQIGIDDKNEFPKPGYSSPSFPFCYHGYHGQVNNKEGSPSSPYSKFSNIKREICVDLTIKNMTVTFTVDGTPQEGSWNIPKTARVLVDIYNVGTRAILQ